MAFPFASTELPLGRITPFSENWKRIWFVCPFISASVTRLAA
jgi:hypothetical protein